MCYEKAYKMRQIDTHTNLQETQLGHDKNLMTCFKFYLAWLPQVRVEFDRTQYKHQVPPKKKRKKTRQFIITVGSLYLGHLFCFEDFYIPYYTFSKGQIKQRKEKLEKKVKTREKVHIAFSRIYKDKIFCSTRRKLYIIRYNREIEIAYRNIHGTKTFVP